MPWLPDLPDIEDDPVPAPEQHRKPIDNIRASPVKVPSRSPFVTLQAFDPDALEEATMLGTVFARFVEKSPLSVMVGSATANRGPRTTAQSGA